MDVPALLARLDACLLALAELREGAAAWRSYPDPFAPWEDAVSS